MNRRSFLGVIAGAAVAVAAGALILNQDKGQPSSTSTASTTSTGSRSFASGSRWVWCEPIRGTWTATNYTEDQIVGYLQKINNIDVLHRIVGQGEYTANGGPTWFTNNSDSLPMVKSWVKKLRDSFPQTKIIGRIDSSLARGLDPSDPALKTTLGNAPSLDLSDPSRQSFLANWGIRYYDNLGIDGIWFDVPSELSNQTPQGWAAVYNQIHDSVEQGFIMQTNQGSDMSTAFVGPRDAIDIILPPADVRNMTDSIDWSSVRSQSAAANSGVSPPITAHIDVPASMQEFVNLSVDNQLKYLHYLASDSSQNGWIHQWPVLCGVPWNLVYDSIQTGTFDAIVSIVNSIQ